MKAIINMQYTIVTGKSNYDLQINVREKLKNGWSLQGGVSFVFYGGMYETWAQAMVKT